MTTRTSNELIKIRTAEELEIASLRQDSTLRKWRTIWVVRVGDDLYVRSVNERCSDWFRGAQTHHEGYIQLGGVDICQEMMNGENIWKIKKLLSFWLKQLKQDRKATLLVP